MVYRVAIVRLVADREAADSWTALAAGSTIEQRSWLTRQITAVTTDERTARLATDWPIKGWSAQSITIGSPFPSS